MTDERMREVIAVAPVKAAGQTVKPVWRHEVTDIWKLARLHPGLVRIEPNTSEINLAIASIAEVSDEPQIPGLRIWRETKVGVRLNARKTIDV